MTHQIQQASTKTGLNKKRLKVAINGFGRIGRNVLRAYIERIIQHQEAHLANAIDIVAINDVADTHTLMHLLKYDTAHGRLSVPITIEQEQLSINIKDKKETIQVLHIASPTNIDWKSLDVDLVLECTGQFRSYQQAKQHINSGAKQVIIGAAPFDDVDACVVYGVNHHELTAEHQVISSVSCTTQAFVPLVKLLDDAYGIDSAMMTEIHAVTADQSVLDKAHRDLRRARSSGQNIIPTTSSSLGALQRVLPNMAGKVDGLSIRVPTLDVAAIDLTVVLKQQVNTDMVLDMFRKHADSDYAEIMQVCNEPLVSSDFIHQPYSLIIDAEQTKVVGNQVKVFAWYDNEWGYANRLIDICLYIQNVHF